MSEQPQDHLHLKFYTDGIYAVLFKLLTNHNVEFALEMMGRMGETACYVMQLTATFADMLIICFVLYFCLSRFVKYVRKP